MNCATSLRLIAGAQQLVEPTVGNRRIEAEVAVVLGSRAHGRMERCELPAQRGVRRGAVISGLADPRLAR